MHWFIDSLIYSAINKPSIRFPQGRRKNCILIYLGKFIFVLMAEQLRLGLEGVSREGGGAIIKKLKENQKILTKLFSKAISFCHNDFPVILDHFKDAEMCFKCALSSGEWGGGIRGPATNKTFFCCFPYSWYIGLIFHIPSQVEEKRG